MSRSTELDADGVEFAVDEGFGRVVNVEWPIEGKRNAHVELDVEGLEYPVKGWANTLDDDIRALLTDPPPRIRYRLEVHRADKVDKSTPIADLAPKQKYRRLVQLVATDSERRTANRPPEPPPPPPTGGHITDTWGYCAALGSVELAYDLAVAARTDGRIDNVTRPMVMAVGRVLLDCANEAQASVRGAVDLTANSHSRARGAVRSAVGYAPPPPIELPTDDDAWQEWGGKVTRAASVLMGAALDLMNGDDKPAAAGAGHDRSQPSAADESPDQPQADRSGTEPSGFEAPSPATDEAPGGDDSPGAGSPLDRVNALHLSGSELVEFKKMVIAHRIPWPVKDLTDEQAVAFGELLASWAQDAA